MHACIRTSAGAAKLQLLDWECCPLKSDVAVAVPKSLSSLFGLDYSSQPAHKGGAGFAAVSSSALLNLDKTLLAPADIDVLDTIAKVREICKNECRDGRHYLCSICLLLAVVK